MTTELIIILIFCYVDDRMRDVMKHPDAKLYPSELVTIGILFSLKGVSFRAFYRCLVWRLAGPHALAAGFAGASGMV